MPVNATATGSLAPVLASTAPEFKKPVLMVAAESIVLAQGEGAGTVADVLRARALEHYGEGLRQYVSIRLRSSSAADGVMRELKKRLAEVSSAALSSPPGPRANLYRMAKRLAEEQEDVITSEGEGLFWQAPPEHAPSGYVTGLARVRAELAKDEAELLELRYARELSPDELAYVIGRDTEDVITALEQAAARATAILGEAPPSRLGGLRGALQEAYALAPHIETVHSGDVELVSTALPVGTVIGERYAVRQRVGEGSFGDVYRAVDTDVPGHVVALKLLHKPATSDEARKTALRELRLIASVFHPSVVDFKDHGWYQDRMWFVMPWYEGETLEERIKREPLTRKEALQIFLPLAQALATMHAAGIRHQDIKPDNIFLARLGDEDSEESQRILPVLIDLGVAAKEAEMIVAGTPLYFAPEIAAQYAGSSERPAVTHKADVFSLALSLRNALEPATQEQVPGTAVEAFIAHRAAVPPALPEDKSLRYLSPHFARWLAREAKHRPTARELCEELSILTEPERRKQRRRSVLRWAAPIVLGSMLGLSSVTYGYLQKRAEAARATERAEETESELGRESERRLALAEKYENSELTRRELSEQLEKRDQEAVRLQTAVARQRRNAEEWAQRARGFSNELGETRRTAEDTRRRLESTQGRLATVQNELYSNEQRRAFLESELREARTRMSGAEKELDELRVRARSLLAELDRARSEAQSQMERASQAEEALRQSRAAQRRADNLGQEPPLPE